MYIKSKIYSLVEKVLPIITIGYLGKNSQSLQVNPAGLHSSSPSASLGLTFINGNDKATMPVTTNRPVDLVENEVALFSLNLASIIKMKPDGTIVINASNVIINGNVTSTGIVKATTDVMIDNTSLLEHTHKDTQPGNGNSGVLNITEEE